MSKTELENQVANGLEAQEILDHPMVNNFLLDIRGELFSAFTRTKTEEAAAREEIWRKMQMVDWFVGHFETYVKTGKMAEQDLTMTPVTPVLNRV